MIKLIFSVLIFGSLVTSAVSAAEGSKQSKKSNTNFNFEDLLVQGKYHFSDEAVTTVEEDKVLDALLPVRKDFRDRLKQTASMR